MSIRGPIAELCSPLYFLNFQTTEQFVQLIPSKQTILTRPTLDFLLPLTSTITDPAIPDDKPKPSSRKQAEPGSVGRKRTKKEPGEPGEGEYNPDPSFANVANPNYLPNIGTWKQEAEVGGGSAEGGRGMFDDYEDDEDDY